MDDALTAGARIGSYEVIDRLGAGGMGEVYRARDTRLGRTVAIKVLRPGADPELLHRLDREARAASALNHPNIVHIYDVGEAAGQSGAHYVVMEYVEGETLRRRLARGALAMPDLLDLGAQIADGLAKAPSLPPPRPQAPAVYHVHVDDKVHIYDEGELTDRIRRGKLTGMELVRRDDEELWQPLFESRVYRREVPSAGDPRDAARWRVLRGLGGHFSGYFITGVVMYSIQGSFPFWMAIWGAVLAVQAAGSAPAIWTLLRRRRIEAAPAVARPVLPAREVPQLPLPAGTAGASSPVAQEAERVRALIEQRGGSDTPRLLAEVDGILKLTTDLSAREVDLEEQTGGRERAALAAAISEARVRLDRAELPQDQRLFERQLEVLQGREEGITKAMRVLERLRVRREVAEHQLKQLRLDLSRGAASGLDIPELSSRLQFIRYEVDAKEEVEGIVADRR